MYVRYELVRTLVRRRHIGSTEIVHIPFSALRRARFTPSSCWHLKAVYLSQIALVVEKASVLGKYVVLYGVKMSVGTRGRVQGLSAQANRVATRTMKAISRSHDEKGLPPHCRATPHTILSRPLSPTETELHYCTSKATSSFNRAVHTLSAPSIAGSARLPPIVGPGCLDDGQILGKSRDVIIPFLALPHTLTVHLRLWVQDGADYAKPYLRLL